MNNLILWSQLDDWHVADLQTQNRPSRWLLIFFSHWVYFTLMLSTQYIMPAKFWKISLILSSLDLCRNFAIITTLKMDTADYWLMAREYLIWNAAIALLQFWKEDLNPVTLGRATEHIYTTFFYSPTSHTLCQQAKETLFGCFVIVLNAPFSQQLSLNNEGYKSGSDNMDLPTPLWETTHIHHISSMEHVSFNPVPTTPCSTPQTLPRQVCRQFSFSSADSSAPICSDTTPICSDSSDEDKEKEDFQRVPLDNDHWTSQETPEKKHLCPWKWITT